MKSMIAEKIVSVIIQVGKKQNCWFIRTYGGQIPHLLIPLSLLAFVL